MFLFFTSVNYSLYRTPSLWTTFIQPKRLPPAEALTFSAPARDSKPDRRWRLLEAPLPAAVGSLWRVTLRTQLETDVLWAEFGEHDRTFHSWCIRPREPSRHGPSLSGLCQEAAGFPAVDARHGSTEGGGGGGSEWQWVWGTLHGPLWLQHSAAEAEPPGGAACGLQSQGVWDELWVENVWDDGSRLWITGHGPRVL